MNQQAVDQLTRRAALQLGTGLFGLSLPGYLAAARAGQVDPARRGYSCIFVLLAGGVSRCPRQHFEQFREEPGHPNAGYPQETV